MRGFQSNQIVPRRRYTHRTARIRADASRRQTKGKGGKQQLCVLAPSSPDKLEEIGKRLADGSLKPIISHRFPMDKAIDAAWAYENKKREGCIVLLPQEWNGQ